MIVKAIRGFFGEFSDRLLNRYGKDITKIEQSTDKEINDLLGNLTSKQLDDLLCTIRTRRAFIDISPAYSNEVASTSKQILSFGAAGIALTFAFIDKLKEVPPSILHFVKFPAFFYLNLTITSFFILFLFLWQSRFRYPFLYLQRIGNTIPFFYYRAISPQTPRQIFQTKKDKLEGIRMYASDFEGFVKYMVTESIQGKKDFGHGESDNEEAAKLRKIVRDEIQQYFLLISYQGYLNQFEVRLTNYFIYGLIGSFISVFPLSLVFPWLTNLLKRWF